MASGVAAQSGPEPLLCAAACSADRQHLQRGNGQLCSAASTVVAAPTLESPATPHRPVSRRTTLEAGAKSGCLDVAKRRQSVHGHRS